MSQTAFMPGEQSDAIGGDFCDTLPASDIVHDLFNSAEVDPGGQAAHMFGKAQDTARSIGKGAVNLGGRVISAVETAADVIETGVRVWDSREELADQLRPAVNEVIATASVWGTLYAAEDGARFRDWPIASKATAVGVTIVGAGRTIGEIRNIQDEGLRIKPKQEA